MIHRLRKAASSLIEVVVSSFLIGVLGFVVLFAILHTAQASRLESQVDFGRQILALEMDSAIKAKMPVGRYDRPVRESQDGVSFHTVVVFKRPENFDEKLQNELMDVEGRTYWKDGKINREVTWSKRVVGLNE